MECYFNGGVSFPVFYSPILRKYFGIGTSYAGTMIVFILIGFYIYIGDWLFDSQKHVKFVKTYVLVCILSTVWVNPANNGMDCIFEKSSVKAVQEIAKNDSEGR